MGLLLDLLSLAHKASISGFEGIGMSFEMLPSAESTGLETLGRFSILASNRFSFSLPM